MKINHNVTAQIANVNLKKDERRVSASLEKLSSGYKITKAADDSAGLAISNKMRNQIRALNQASRNSEDGQSVVQTADGALNEVTSILQRIRELTVQNANDTYTIEDRAASQNEIDQLLDEIDRISSTTEFNGKGLLDGSSARSITSSADGIQALKASLQVPSGDYQFSVSELPQPAVAEDIEFTIPGTLFINNTNVEITADDTEETASQKILDICNKMDIDVEFSGTSCTFTTKAAGDNQHITIRNSDGQNQLFMGSDAQIELGDGFSENAKVTADGGHVTIIDNGGFEMLVEIPSEIPEGSSGDGDVTLKVYDAGYMGVQIGANENQMLDMNFDEVSCNTLSLRDSNGQRLINVCSQHGAEMAIASLDVAIERVSATRSELGAYQNRLEDTTSSLDVAAYNMTNSMSRIIDTDMADEMTQYTQLNVLTQAATTMLSQANSKPQEIMNLLQGM